MQKKTIFFAGIVLCLIILASVGFYWYQKPRSGLASIPPAYTVSAKELYSAFEQDEKKANQQFITKVIEVKGIVDNVQLTDSMMSLFLSSGNSMGGINCSVVKDKNEIKTPPSKGSVVRIKGRCIGFLMDVNLVDAIILP